MLPLHITNTYYAVNITKYVTKTNNITNVINIAFNTVLLSVVLSISLSVGASVRPFARSPVCPFASSSVYPSFH